MMVKAYMICMEYLVRATRDYCLSLIVQFA